MVINPCGLSDFSNVDNFYHYSHDLFKLFRCPHYLNTNNFIKIYKIIQYPKFINFCHYSFSVHTQPNSLHMPCLAISSKQVWTRSTCALTTSSTLRKVMDKPPPIAMVQGTEGFLLPCDQLEGAEVRRAAFWLLRSNI